MLREQGVGQDARGDGAGLLSKSVIVLAFGPLDDLVRFLVEMEARATPKRGQRDHCCNQIDSSSACDRSHPSPPAPRDSRLEGMFGIEAVARQGAGAAPLLRLRLG